MRVSAASSNAGFGGTLTKHTLQTVYLHKILNSVHGRGRLKVWPTVIIRINTAASVKFLALNMGRLLEGCVYSKQAFIANLVTTLYCIVI